MRKLLSAEYYCIRSAKVQYQKNSEGEVNLFGP